MEFWGQVAAATPDADYWGPSREYDLVKTAACEAMRRIGVYPENFTFRMSALMIGDPGPAGYENTSTVHATRPPEGSYMYPALDQNNQCGNCRACWNQQIKNVSYWLHSAAKVRHRQPVVRRSFRTGT